MTERNQTGCHEILNALIQKGLRLGRVASGNVALEILNALIQKGLRRNRLLPGGRCFEILNALIQKGLRHSRASASVSKVKY